MLNNLLVLIVLLLALQMEAVELSEKITLTLSEATIKDLSVQLQAQSVYGFGMPKEVQSIDGLSINVVDLELSEVLTILKKDFELCAWIWQRPPSLKHSPDMLSIRWAKCGAGKPRVSKNYVAFRY